MKKDFDPSEWLEKNNQVASAPESSQFSEGSAPIRPISPIRPIKTLEDEIEQLVCSVESASADIAPDYASWRDLGFALADALGESGRSYFHRLSRFYPGYSEKEADKQFTACLKSKGSGITINTLFHLAKQSGIKLVRNSVKPYNVKERISPNSSPEESSELEELEESPMPTFSQDIYSLLPNFLTQIINKAKNFEDADLLLLGSLTAISACLPNISGNYAEREVFPNLFLFVAAQASAGKGRLTLCRHLIKPIHDSLKKNYAAEMDEYRHLQNEYVQDKKNREPPVEPPIKTLLIPANSSATSVYQVLNDNGGVGLIFETEGDTLANSFKSDYGNFSDGFRKAFHHEMISYTRRKDREFVELTKPRLSAMLSGTPKQIFSLIPDAENGLFSRFIFYNMNLRLEWRDVFSQSTDTLDDYFIRLGFQFFEFYHKLQQAESIRFSLSASQQAKFNQFFGDVQLEYANLFGTDIIASVRRLGLISFRLAMILTALRLMDGKDIAPVVVCDDIDFNNVLCMARVLIQHAAHVFAKLPTTEPDTSKSNTTVLCQKFFDLLPSEFNRSTYLSVAERLHISPKTAEKYLRKLCTTGQLQHVTYGQYSKI
ncbi:MAG: DUF3987 domain-containing protein [Bacteroidales bacterium]|nr:DUF3987 domain-containing protein [Bacteroidales bacterium]